VLVKVLVLLRACLPCRARLCQLLPAVLAMAWRVAVAACRHKLLRKKDAWRSGQLMPVVQSCCWPLACWLQIWKLKGPGGYAFGSHCINSALCVCRRLCDEWVTSLEGVMMLASEHQQGSG
jgi:hypothetical protein